MSSLALYELVHSLSRNEKGYFVKQISKSNSTYVRLFKTIASQKTYDEARVKSLFDGTYIGNNFSFAKGYLYDSIIKTLMQYGAKQKDVQYYFAAIKFLYHKGLYGNCAKLLRQVLKKALHVNDYLSILRVIEYTKLLMHSNLFSDSELIQLISQEPSILEKQQVLSTFQSLLVEIKAVRQETGKWREQYGLEQIDQIKNHPYLQDKSHVIDNNCEQIYHEIKFLIGYLMSDSELCKKHIKPLHNMILNPEYSDTINDYRKIDLLMLHVRYTQMYLGDAATQESFLEIRGFLERPNELDRLKTVEAFSFLYSFETNFLLQQKTLGLLKKWFDEIDGFMVKNKKLVSKEFKEIIQGNKLVYHFIAGEYREASRLLDKFLTHAKKNKRKDIVISAMLTEVLVLIELGKNSLFESRLNSFNRYLKKHKVEELVWTLYAEFFNDLIKGKDIVLLSKELLVKIDSSLSDANAMDIHFLVDWLKKKCGEA